MILPITRRTALALLAGSGLAGCASPNPELYTLVAVPGREVTVRRRTITMRAVNVARYLERPEIVRYSEDYQLDVRPNAWWGEPLSPMISRILIDDLNQRAQGASIFPESSGMSSNVDASLEVSIQRLDEDRSGAVQLRAQIVLIPQEGKQQPSYRTVRLQTTPPTPDIRGEAAAMSAALGQLADQIAQMLQG